MDGTLSHPGIELDMAAKSPVSGSDATLRQAHRVCTGVYKGLVVIPGNVKPTVTHHGNAVMDEMHHTWHFTKNTGNNHLHDSHP